MEGGVILFARFISLIVIGGCAERHVGSHHHEDHHDLAMAHHRAADDLAESMVSNDIKRVLPQLERTQQACVDCHRVYKQ
jgi:hypothetical protein